MKTKDYVRLFRNRIFNSNNTDMEKMSLLKLIFAQIMANDNNGIYPHNLYERRGPKFNPNYTVKDKDSMRQEREFNINGIKVMAYSRKDALQRLKHKNKRK